jgi:hypothetical protein
MKSDKRLTWLAAGIFILTILMWWSCPLRPKNAYYSHWQNTIEPLLSGVFFSFISLLYFIPRIRKFWKIPVCGMLVTFIGLTILSLSFVLTTEVHAIFNGKPIKMPFEHYGLSTLWHIMIEFLVFSTLFNIAPLVAFCPYYYFQKRISQKMNIHSSPPRDWPSKITFPCNIKLTLFVAAGYMIFIIVYDLLVRPEGPMVIYNIPTGEGPPLRSYILGYIFPLYFISFFSLLISMPSLIGRVKRGIAYCALIPLFWNVVILAVYAAMILFSTWNTKFFREDIFTLHYYVGRYFETRAWSISFPLLAIWGFCHFLLKAEWNKQAGHSADQIH